MKRTFASFICVAWLLNATFANAADWPLLKKSEPAVTVTLPWEQLSERTTSLAKQLLDRPTVVAHGPSETFPCVPEQYIWLLDNPDRAVTAWRRLGTKCVSITRRPGGKFGYADETGTDVSWEVIHQTPNMRVWFAEGKVKPSAVLPLVPVKAMVVLRHSDGKTADGVVVVQHQADVVIHTDSKAASAVTKMMGKSGPKLAEQGLGQLEMFYSALSAYLDRHPDRAESLFRPETATTPNPMNKDK